MPLTIHHQSFETFNMTSAVLATVLLLAACSESGNAPLNAGASQTRVSASEAQPGLITAGGVDFSKLAAMCAATLKTISLNGNKCGGGGPLEQVSNSIAADENSNIYVVTSDAQYRIDWNGMDLKTAWRAPYQGAGNSGAGRLGAGSGSTPTLMGTREGDDRFVVITDGAKLVNVVYMWRDAIPAG